MDRYLYVGMSGAKETMRAQAVNNHNLANVSTTGFRADLSAFQSRAVAGAGFASRTYATNTTTGWDQTGGATLSTGRELDVAVQGNGWIAVQANDGNEAFTRAGDFHVDASGSLVTGAGHPVMGASGPITVPPYSSINIAGDGTISIVPLGQSAATNAAIGRVRLVNPPASTLERGADGLFRSTDTVPPPDDLTVHLASGNLESSNVNIADAMVNMIELARRFELQIKTIRSAEENGASSAQLLKAG